MDCPVIYKVSDKKDIKTKGRKKEIEDDEECINVFLHNWLDNDGYYYRWEYSLLKNREEKIVGVSLAALTYC